MTERNPISLAAETPIDSDADLPVASECTPDPELREFAAGRPDEISLEDPAPVIDIHPPHHGAMTRRDILTHLVIVVFGILIAICLEQTVEAIHHARERHALIEDFHNECSANLKVFDFDLGIVQRNIAWDRASLAVLRNAKPEGGSITITTPPEPVSGMHAPSRSVWAVAKSSGKVELLPENLAEIFDRVDNEGAHFNDVVQLNVSAQQRISSFAERTGSPLDTAETIHLTLAQRDEAASLIDSCLVQDEQYQLWLSSWQGASQGVVDGVQTRDALDPYIHLARTKLR